MEVYAGYLTVKTPSLIKTKTYNHVWGVLYSGRGNLCPRIDLYQDSSNVGHTTCKKTIYIEEAKWKRIDSLEPTFSFEIKHSKQYIFICGSESELKAWALHLCCVSGDLFENKHVIGIYDGDKMDTSINGEEFVVQENVLYSTCRDMHSFNVVADKTEGCLHFGLKGLFKLTVESSCVRLLNHETGREVSCWFLNELRNFGHSPHTFFVHAGSRCKSGEGKFIFHTTEGEKIVQSLSQQAERIRKNDLNTETVITPATAAQFPGNMTAVGGDTHDISAGHLTSDSNKKKMMHKPPAPPKPKLLSVSSEVLEESPCEYQNMGGQQQLPPLPSIKNKLAPTAPIAPNGIPTPQPAPRSQGHGARRDSAPGGVDQNFLKQLDERVGHPHLDPANKLSRTRSASPHSSESDSKRGSKKALKEQKKEKKRREEEEKREKKRKEEEEKRERKRKEEEEKKKQKESKKGKNKVSKTLSNQKQDPDTSLYAEADDCISSPPPAYSEVAPPEKIYCEPWKNDYPHVGNLQAPDKGETVYAQPEKTPGKKAEGREIVHVENYEEVQSVQGSAPPIIPPSWIQDEDDANNNVYDHMHQEALNSSSQEQEHVYGMASASVPYSVTPEENPYEDTCVNDTYERVG